MEQVFHLVYGFFRTGTSMMMGALVKGSEGALRPAYSEEREKELAKAFDDDTYEVNPTKYWEYQWDTDDQLLKNFPMGLLPEYNLIKRFYRSPLKMSDEVQYRVVLLTRDPEEIRQSYEAAFGVSLDADRERRRGREPGLVALPNWPTSYFTLLDRARDSLKKHGDRIISTTEASYSEIIERPRKLFDHLLQEGWPISNLDAAVEHVNPDLYRFRLDLLEAGI